MPTEIIGLDLPQCVDEFVGPFTAVCEEEPCKVEWSVKETPDNIDIEQVEFSAPHNLETLIKFPSRGKYVLCVKCWLEQLCHPFVNESEGKQLNIFCAGFDGLVCGQAVGFAAGDTVTFTDDTGLTQIAILSPSGLFCIPLTFADGATIDAIVNGENHNGCPTSASTTFVIDTAVECIPFDISCMDHGFHPTYVNCNQVCGGPAGLWTYDIGDTVSVTANGNVYTSTIIADPNPDPQFNGQPIWCIDLSDDDYEAVEGNTLVLTMTDGTCTTIYPYVHI